MPIKSYYESQYGLKGNPFPSRATYGQDSQTIYVPEMFGQDRDQFLRKFILAPLENRQPLIGAIWSVMKGDPRARGFGKSTLMAEESKQINRDFGKSTLLAIGVPEDDAQHSPVLAGYVSFDVKGYGGIANIDAAAFNLARFILQTRDAAGVSTHIKLREMAAAQLVNQGLAETGHEGAAIVRSVKEKFQRLAVTIDIRNLLEDYLFHLSSADTDALEQFLNDEVSTWHHDRNGLKYLQILVVLGRIAGIEHFTFFIDQVEDFTSVSGSSKIQKNVKIIRDALIESEPFSSCASFVFQLHPLAYQVLHNAWEHEDLPSLDYSDPLNKPIVLVLKGLEEFRYARILVERMLNHPSVALPTRTTGIAPFTYPALEYIWTASKPKPRDFLRTLNRILELGSSERAAILDEAFIQPILEHVVQSLHTDEDETTIDERTT